jgi:hypothetical protein
VVAWVGRANDLPQKDVVGFLCLMSALRDSEFDFWIIDGEETPGVLMSRLAEWHGDRVRYFSKVTHDSVADIYRAIAASAERSSPPPLGRPPCRSWRWRRGLAAARPFSRAPPASSTPRSWGASLMYDRRDGVGEIIRCLRTLQQPENRRISSRSRWLAIPAGVHGADDD